MALDDSGFALQSARPRGFDRVLKWGALAAVVGALAWSAQYAGDAWRWLTGKPARYRPQHAVALAQIDLEAVHVDRWTKWIVAASHATPGVPDDELAQARTAMREAIAADQNLVELFDELDGLVTTGNLRSERVRDRTKWLTYAWNDYLDASAQPYFVHTNVLLNDKPLFYAHTYRVLADSDGTVGDERLRVRALGRLDRIGLRELYLGYVTSDTDGALLLVDRLAEHVLEQLWPMLAGPEHVPLDYRRYADAVIAEATRELPADVMAELTATAVLRADAVAAVDAMVERMKCSRLSLTKMPFDGYDQEALFELADLVETGECAAVRNTEFDALRRASEQLKGRPALEDALQQLAAWAARPVAVHELRHAADELVRDDDDDKRDCTICDATDPDLVRAEVAAYLAELAWSTVPATALHQICRSTADDTDDMTVHGRARAIVLKGLQWSCRDGVPDDISDKARALERSAFGRSDAIVLGASFPTHMAVVSERARRAAAEPD
ncbi:MAG TPA: hypothetical protein VG755_20165 [Nannocystaceae bacterium]|nr:hypothetical protein [Nannocystaceae bacterium]